MTTGEQFVQGEPAKVAGRKNRQVRIFELSYAAGIAGVYAERIIDLEDRVAALEAAAGYTPPGMETR